MSNLKIEFTDKEITPWGSIALLEKMLDKMPFCKVLEEAPLPV